MDNKEQLVSLKGNPDLFSISLNNLHNNLFLNKVMRLLKPSMYSALPIYTEKEHFSDNFSKLLLDQAFNMSQQMSISNPNCSLTDFLVIPQIFG